MKKQGVKVGCFLLLTWIVCRTTSRSAAPGSRRKRSIARSSRASASTSCFPFWRCRWRATVRPQRAARQALPPPGALQRYVGVVREAWRARKARHSGADDRLVGRRHCWQCWAHGFGTAGSEGRTELSLPRPGGAQTLGGPVWKGLGQVPAWQWQPRRRRGPRNFRHGARIFGELISLLGSTAFLPILLTRILRIITALRTAQRPNFGSTEQLSEAPIKRPPDLGSTGDFQKSNVHF